MKYDFCNYIFLFLPTVMNESQEHKLQVKQKFKQLKCCVLLPTYNNAKTIEGAIQSSLVYCDDVIIVNDGCMNSTSEILAKYLQLKVVTNLIKRGKGVGFKIVPIWGFQFALAIFAAVFFKLNKIIIGLTAQISLSPLILFLLYASAKTGEYVLNQKINLDFSKLLTIEKLKNLYVYYVGTTVLSVVIGIVGFVVIWLLLKLFGYKPSANESES